MDRNSESCRIMRDKALAQLRTRESLTGKDGAFGPLSQEFLEAALIQKMKDTSDLHDKGLMSDYDFNSMKLEYKNRNKKDVVINPVNQIFKRKF